MSNTALVKSEQATQVAVIEQALVQGNLANLTPDQRAAHYLRVCDSLGLNPHTQPLDYITLNGKLTLYAKRSCTDQLRKIHGVCIVGEPVKRVEDGVLTVTIRVRDKDGREDVDEGAVSVAGLKGDALANAHMKAITKAKRRATLSLCGLGWLDESEVETVSGAKVGEPEPPRHQTPPATAPTNGNGHAEAPARQLPRNGVELYQRLKALEDGLVKEKKCKPAALFTHVREAGLNQGYSDDLARWNDPEQIAFAVDAVKVFLNARRVSPAAPTPDGLALHNWCRQRGKELHAQAGCTNEDDLLKWMAEHGKKKGWGSDITQWRGQQLADGETEAERWLAEQWERVRAQGEPVEGEVVTA